MDEFDADVFANFDLLVLERVDSVVVDVGFVVELAHLFFDHADGELGSIDRGVLFEFRQDMATGADVVKVSVSKEDGLDTVDIVLEVLDIWNHIVDARIVVGGEKGAHIDDDGFVFVLDDGHVLADTKFSKTTELNDTDGVGVKTSILGLIWGNLGPIKAVEFGLVDRNADDVLGGLCVDVRG